VKLGVLGKKLGVMRKLGVMEKMGMMRRPRCCGLSGLKIKIVLVIIFCFSVIYVIMLCAPSQSEQGTGFPRVSHMEIRDKFGGMIKFGSENP